MADRVEAFCARWVRRAPGPTLLVLAGGTGCGKTAAARRAVAWARAIGVEALSRGWASVPSASLVAWSDLASPECVRGDLFADRLRELRDESLLVLDDVGSEIDRFRTGAPIERLRRVLDERRGRHTIVTTNFGPSEWGTAWDVRVADRLCRDAEIVLLDAPPYSLLAAGLA